MGGIFNDNTYAEQEQYRIDAEKRKQELENKRYFNEEIKPELRESLGSQTVNWNPWEYPQINNNVDQTNYFKDWLSKYNKQGDKFFGF